MPSAKEFRDLHHAGEILLMPNAWDVGSAKLLAHLGFRAVATTSSGSAAALGRLDGSLSRDVVMAHCEELAKAVDVPISADLENCFADDPSGVAETITLASGTGVVGASIEDWDGEAIYDRTLAAERVGAAAEAADGSLVITGRADNHIHGVHDLDDTVARLQAYRQAGADVVYAPGIHDADQIRAVVSSVDAPVNVLVRSGVPRVGDLAELGVRRISVGGAFAFAAYSTLIDAARELQGPGTYGYLDGTGRGVTAIREAFSPT